MKGPNPSKEQFRQMLLRYLSKKAGAHEKSFVERWYDSFGNDSRLNLSTEQRHELEQRLWESIVKQKGSVHQSGTSVGTPKKIVIATSVAASVILVSVCLLYFLTPNSSVKQLVADNKVDFVPYVINNPGTTPRTAKLPDGTNVKLEPSSSLAVNKIEGEGTREVHLTGEAFFQVAHDPSRPFFVYTGNITTKVLGTSFTVSARENIVFVAVRTGKVSVTKTTHKSFSPQHTLTEEVILTPNQKAIYNGQQISMTIVEKPQRILKEKAEPHMEFDEQPVTEILEALEEAYGIAILYDVEVLNTCSLTTTLSNEDLYDRLNIICKAIKGTYRVEGSSIRIISNGCH